MNHTETTTINPTDEKAARVTRWTQDLSSGKIFDNHERSARSVIGWQPMVDGPRYGQAKAVIAKTFFTGSTDKFTVLGAALLACGNLYGTENELAASFWRVAAEVTGKDHDNVARRTGPEPVRHSDAQEAWTDRDKLQAYVWIMEACAELNLGSLPAIGWCAAAACEILNVRR